MMESKQYIESCMKRFNVYNHTKISLPLCPNSLTSLQERPTADEEKQYMKNKPYRNLHGCLLYISGHYIPDVNYVVISLSQVSDNPGQVHWSRLLKLLKYLDTTKDFALDLPFDNPSL